MNFKYSVIGDNSQDNREWLEKVGYKELHASNCPCRYLYSTSEGYCLTSPILSTYAENNSINCRSNPQLFQAVTAMKEASDYMQWYYNQYYEEWSICEQEDAFDYFSLDWMWHARKATLEELQERFKEKER